MRAGRSVSLVIAVVAALVFAPAAVADTAKYILPPGNFGGLPTTTNSLDQLPLYDGLTPLRGNVTAADINSHFLNENFTPIGATHTENTGRPGLRLVYDAYGVPHVYGKTRADMAFGAGWTTARDRGLLVTVGRGPARVAARRRARHRRLLAGHQRAVLHPEPAGRGPRDEAAQAARQDLRRQGQADHRRRPGLRRRHQRLLQVGEPDAGLRRRRTSTT